MMNVPKPSRKPTAAERQTGFFSGLNSFLGTLTGRALESYEVKQMHERDKDMLRLNAQLQSQNSAENQRLNSASGVSSMMPNVDPKIVGLAVAAFAVALLLTRK